MNHKVGDKVTVRSDLQVTADWEGPLYGGLLVIEEMRPFLGKTVTIDQIDPENACNDTAHYHIEEDCGYAGWTDEMFEETK